MGLGVMWIRISAGAAAPAGARVRCAPGASAASQACPCGRGECSSASPSSEGKITISVLFFSPFQEKQLAQPQGRKDLSH